MKIFGKMIGNLLGSRGEPADRSSLPGKDIYIYRPPSQQKGHDDVKWEPCEPL